LSEKVPGSSLLRRIVYVSAKEFSLRMRRLHLEALQMHQILRRQGNISDRAFLQGVRYHLDRLELIDGQIQARWFRGSGYWSDDSYGEQV
jgi:hypothetical protein